MPLDAALGLWAVGRDALDPQLAQCPPNLRLRLPAPQLLALIRRSGFHNNKFVTPVRAVRGDVKSRRVVVRYWDGRATSEGIREAIVERGFHPSAAQPVTPPIAQTPTSVVPR